MRRKIDYKKQEKVLLLVKIFFFNNMQFAVAAISIQHHNDMNVFVSLFWKRFDN